MTLAIRRDGNNKIVDNQQNKEAVRSEWTIFGKKAGPGLKKRKVVPWFRETAPPVFFLRRAQPSGMPLEASSLWRGR